MRIQVLPTIADVAEILEDMAPSVLAEPWDNVGLQVGHRQWPVRKILIALDPTLKLITQAAGQGADLVITHHPLIFHPILSLNLESPAGEIIGYAIEKRVGIFCCHTNLDHADGGLNDMLAARLGVIKDLVCLSPQQKDLHRPGIEGLGRIGTLESSMPLEDFVDLVKHALNIKVARVIGRNPRMVQRVALCSGSGKSLLDNFLHSNADVFVTGDIGYHDGQKAIIAQRTIIDAGHFATEQIMVDGLTKRLAEAIAERNLDIQIEPYSGDSDCFSFI